jgi:hypothetical protein
VEAGRKRGKLGNERTAGKKMLRIGEVKRKGTGIRISCGITEALFTSPVFSPPKDVGIWCSPNTLKFSQILFPKILYHNEEFLI